MYNQNVILNLQNRMHQCQDSFLTVYKREKFLSTLHAIKVMNKEFNTNFYIPTNAKTKFLNFGSPFPLKVASVILKSV